jgi:hypothetical protein
MGEKKKMINLPEFLQAISITEIEFQLILSIDSDEASYLTRRWASVKGLPRPFHLNADAVSTYLLTYLRTYILTGEEILGVPNNVKSTIQVSPWS